MNFLKRLLGIAQPPNVTDGKSFWAWFTANEKDFYRAIRQKTRIDANFLEKIMPRLQEVNGGFYCLAGMYDEQTAELVITAEGDIKTFVFAEDLVAMAPVLKGWKFTALKQAVGLGTSVKMGDYLYECSKISFFSNGDDSYPDEIDISLVHADYKEEDKQSIRAGTFIYLDNALGELNTAILIDQVTITGAQPGQPALIPIEKLNDFLIWREKEFVEKYGGIRHNTGEDSYAIMEATDENGLLSIAVINQDLLAWDAAASHPWMLMVEIKYDGKNNNGMPREQEYALMEKFEEALTEQLPDHAGYLNLGRETCNGERTIYFACNEFRKVSRITNDVIKNHHDRLDISYNIFKDKYWRMMERFKQTV